MYSLTSVSLEGAFQRLVEAIRMLRPPVQNIVGFVEELGRRATIWYIRNNYLR